MVFLENLKSELEKYKPQVEEVYSVFDIENIKEKSDELNEKAAEPGFWDDLDNSQKVLQQTRNLEAKVETYNKLKTSAEDIEVMIEMAAEEDDDSVVEEIQQELTALGDELEKIRLSTLLKGEYDSRNAILTLHAGAGGTEAQDWTEMLY